jgi:undecaprenyl-diphosphatase
MTYLQSIILGIIQGLTEFLPVSSSAHLVLFPYWLGWQIPATDAFIFNVLVQLGTLLAVIIYFWRDLVNIARSMINGIIKRQLFKEADARLGWLVILATIPAGFAGLFLKDTVEAAFSSPIATALLLLVTAGMLLLAEKARKAARQSTAPGWLDAIIIGIFQALSIFPGVSRSGSTITGGLLRGLDRTTAARFSFLMSIPIMTAAGGVAFLDMLIIPNLIGFLPVMAAGFIAAAVVGLLSIKWLMGYIRSHSFLVFAVYCVLVSAFTLVLSFIRG